MPGTLDYTTTYTLMSCGECGISFAVPRQWHERKKEDHSGWYCPNGHSRAFIGITEAEKLRRVLDRERNRSTHLRDQLDASENSLRAQRGVATKLRKKLGRVDNGTCPHCSRTFKDLARHMKCKHGGAK